MSNIRITPTPEVQHLPTLFRKIDTGEIRIPAFQRRFVWKESQIIKLLESVYRGYPIGSILLWRVESATLRISEDESVPFPKLPEKYPLTFILDGMQRLSALYGVFYNENLHSPSKFNVIYDLELKMFRHYDQDDLPNVYLPLSALSSPKKLIYIQRNLSELPDGDEYIDATVNLHAIFQEYLIPTVTISRLDTKDIVEIFERINTTGTVLSSFDFMRAMTWSSDFDLDSEISNIAIDYEYRGFQFSPETLVKGLAIIFGIAPIPDEMLALRSKTPSELHKAITILNDTISKITAFLQNELSIFGTDFIPYEGQTLVFIKAFSSQRDLTPEEISVLKKWFWAVGFNEGLRGKPDNFVARTISSVGLMLDGQIETLNVRFSLQMSDFLERRFFAGSALSASVAMLFSACGARSIVSGERIDPEFFLSEFGRENFEPFLPVEVIKPFYPQKSPIWNRILSNIFVVTETDKIHLRGKNYIEIIQGLYEKLGTDEALKVLDSQLFPSSTLEIVQSPDPTTHYNVLHYRSLMMLEKAKGLSV